MTVHIRRIPVQLGQRSYKIIVGHGLLTDAAKWLAPLQLGRRSVVITDRNVAHRFGKKLMAALNAGGYKTSLVVIPAGEKAKTLAQTARIYNALLDARLGRDGFVMGLGGGVVGDLAGFVAATYLRGIDFVQVPTSLVAQVDAAIGGKTGVNLSRGKNLVGAFWQPRLVLCDLDTLKTLPAREYRSGWAEVIKYGIIRDADLFGVLGKFLQIAHGDSTGRDAFESRGRRRGRLNHSTIQPFNEIPMDIVTRCCQIKAEIVSADEHENDQRALLNFGHTLGHALETATNYRRYSHGEAISIGMVAAAWLSVKHAGLATQEADRIQNTLQAAGLPTLWPRETRQEKILQAIQLDKKVRAGKIRFVLIRRIGEALISNDMTWKAVREVINVCRG